MNRYLTFNSSTLGYQTIARNAHNQTFVFYPMFTGMLATLEGRHALEFKSDLNYQLAVL